MTVPRMNLMNLTVQSLRAQWRVSTNTIGLYECLNALAERHECNILCAMKWTWMPAALVVLLLALSACDLNADEDVTPTVTEPTVGPSPSSTPPEVSTPQTSEPLPPPAQGITLTVWTSAEIAPNNEVPGGPVLLEQLSTFDSERADVNILVELKTISDQGGTLSYLRTGHSVAPGILPDIILLPSSQLPSAAGEGLIFPLDTERLDEAVEDLHPVARDLVEVDEEIYGYPFALTNLNHIVYDRSVITETVSTNWSQLVADTPGVFVFPAAGASGASLTAQFYRQLGGTFIDDTGQPTLQSEPLEGALGLMQEAVTAGFIDPQSASASNPDQVWQIFAESSSRIVQTNANVFLTRRAEVATGDLRTLPLPGPNGALTSTVGALTWAVSTPDAERQALAVELIDWLVSAPNMGAWCLQSNRVPARRAAFDEWPSDSYTSFLQRQLEVAQPEPAELSNTILTALSDATSAVILGVATPAESAEEAISALRP